MEGERERWNNSTKLSDSVRADSLVAETNWSSDDCSAVRLFFDERVAARTFYLIFFPLTLGLIY